MKEIKIYLDTDKIKGATGFDFSKGTSDIEGDNFLQNLGGLLWFLKTHNKNYTKEQESKIDDLFEMITNCKSEWEITREGRK